MPPITLKKQRQFLGNLPPKKCKKNPIIKVGTLKIKDGKKAFEIVLLMF